MNGWLQITVLVAVASVGILFLLAIFRRFFSASKQEKNISGATSERAESIQTGIHKLHQLNLQKRLNYYVFRSEISSKPLFSWADHPSLVTDAVEYGWSRFAFSASHAPSASVRSAQSTLLGACASVDRREMETEISWEVSQGSAEFMQKIRLNSGLQKNHHSIHGSACSAIKTALPLPGPPLVTSSFPQEAYFEITILASQEDGQDPFRNHRRRKMEGEKAKLIQENSNSKAKAKANSESLVHVTNNKKNVDELRMGGKAEEAVVMSLGLTRGGSLPLKLPGFYPGSIGFNSDGSIYLDGIKLIFESEKDEWGKTDKVIGCGYNPSQRKVFFTVDSQLVHVINCKSEEFGTPLYPTLAANIDIMVLVNFGQSPFKYSPANAQRTPNPCFVGPLANSPSLGYEDSKELFSMGRIDAQWLNRYTARSVHSNGGNNKGSDFDEESEGDLFEIVLESSGRSPNTVLQ
ncbi:Protein ssh4 like [Actinidia chinensis var. chinensis]|uniref:Protein ssh4 like n=1 Tax=Actinidia chinensis var. chinensis TaxID=1590841 RepID=A0A2R6RN40_ACTCC|nr:Protein ssh4 like [Actinidia chinensis var. chinensis]